MINEFKCGQNWKIWPSPHLVYQFTVPLKGFRQKEQIFVSGGLDSSSII